MNVPELIVPPELIEKMNASIDIERKAIDKTACINGVSPINALMIDFKDFLREVCDINGILPIDDSILDFDINKMVGLFGFSKALRLF